MSSHNLLGIRSYGRKANMNLQLIHDAIKCIRSNGDIANLSRLLHPDVLSLDIILRLLLTYLPVGTEPESYVPFLQYIAHDHSTPIDHSSHDPSLNIIEEDGAHPEFRGLRLLPLAYPKYPQNEHTDLLTLFLIHQAHKIDEETGSLDLVRRLLQPFVDHSEFLRTWMISTLLPLIRLEYQANLETKPSLALNEFETMQDRDIIYTLLKRASVKDRPSTDHPARDLRELIEPWIYGNNTRKRRKIRHNSEDAAIPSIREKESNEEGQGSETWSLVYSVLFDLASQDYSQAVAIFEEWKGPGDADYGEWGEERQPAHDTQDFQQQLMEYAQVGLAVIYTNQTASYEALEGFRQILKQISRLLKMPDPSDNIHPHRSISPDLLPSISHTHLRYNNLLRRRNPLTWPSLSAIAFLNLVLQSATELLRLGLPTSCEDVVELILFRTATDHIVELQRVIHSLKSRNLSDQDWVSTRSTLLWLRDWETNDKIKQTEDHGILSKISITELDLELLRAMLETGCYKTPLELYAKKNAPLSSAQVHEAVLEVALSAYDAASNGNRTRGGLKKASDIIQTFRSQFANSQELSRVAALLAATHSMSFYSLTLQNGVPLQPVNIRVHKDPMGLVAKILSQNPRSYTHLDDLLDIGQNLVAAGLGGTNSRIIDTPAVEIDASHQLLIARRRVTRMAIEAALAEDDFDTAYSYVVSRLHVEAKAQQQAEKSPIAHDDISWRAAYAAGRYPTSNSGTSALRRIEQRMELLSQALLLAPPAALAELLGVWQTCEQNLNEILAQDAALERQADESQQLQHIPGGFSADTSPPRQKPRDHTKSSRQEEAPMGLFDAAREVGASLGKTAFPLRGGQKSTQRGTETTMHNQGVEHSEAYSGAGRVRKRDMVSNMVTGGLASGIGWVIGEC